MSKKNGRNSPCSCGSGIKYKKCCLNKQVSSTQSNILNAKLIANKLKAKEQQIIKQQGYGRQIVSEECDGKRFIVVGGDPYWGTWQTFNDFLCDYLKKILGSGWGRNEQKKEFKDQHPLIQCFKIAGNYLEKYTKNLQKNELYSYESIGAIEAIQNLAYNLYLLAHNAKIQKILIRRLKNKDQFYDAFYETQVAALLIYSGFLLEMEDETDNSCTHCEFTATAKDTKIKYSVEAKSRRPDKKNVGINRQLYKALKKQAQHKRIVFIEMNIPDLISEHTKIIAELERLESSTQIDTNPVPSAYLFITNNSYLYNLEDTKCQRGHLVYGFKINDFGNINQLVTLGEALDFREKHLDIEHLHQCIKYYNVPSTFDGELPIFAFNKELRKKRILIGNKYLIPDKNGNEIVAILTTATVSEESKEVLAGFHNGLICKMPISDEELIAYKQNPDTFFGVPLSQGKKLSNEVELYDFFYNSYKENSKEKILDLLKISSDSEIYQNLSKEQLLRILCESYVYGAIKD